MRSHRFALVLLSAATLSSAYPAFAHKVAPPHSERVIKTPMATIRFGTKLQAPVRFQHRLPNGRVLNGQSGTEVPGLLVETTRGIADPNPQTITPQVANLGQIEKAEGLVEELRKEFSTRQSYLSAGDVQGPLQPYVAMTRKEQVIDAYQKLLSSTPRMNAQQKNRAMIAFQQLRARIRWDVDHKPGVGEGVAQDYHPYSRPFDQGLELLRAVAHDEIKHAVRNALNYVARRKTALGGSQIREWDAEVSLGLRVAADTEDQESVSIKGGTENDYLPTYVTMRLKSSGLPTALQPHAGQAVYRVGNDYYVDGTGTKLTGPVAAHLNETPIEYAQMTLRKLAAGEVLRPEFKFDWTGSGGIDVTPVDIGWWGHCHIEAPLAALGIEAKTKVTFYNEHIRKDVVFDPARSNDLLFALFDTERMMDPATGQQRQLDKTTFVGMRNDALEGFGDEIRIKHAGGEFPIQSRLLQIFKPGGSVKPVDQTFLFQRRLDRGNGLVANPEFLKQEQGDVHVIKGDRKVVAEIRFGEWDSAGVERERRQWVTIDPQKPARVLIGGQVTRNGGSAIMTKYYLNQRDKTIESLSWRGARQADGSFKRTLINAVQPGAAPAGEEFAGIGGMPKFDVAATGVKGFDLSRELTMEGAEDIGEFLEDSIRHNQGAVVETSPDGPVWNFPMRNTMVTDVTKTPQTPGRLFEDLFRTYEKVEMTANGKQTVVARTRDANGKVDAAELKAPFLDFAWRPERWHALPYAQGLVNYDALKRGLLIGKDVQGNLSITDGFYGMASDVLYLSMVDPSKSALWGIRRKDGKLEYYDSETAYKQAISRLPQ